MLDLGSNTIELKLIHDDQEVVYTLHVERGSTLDYIKASNTGAATSSAGALQSRAARSSWVRLTRTAPPRT